MDFDETLSNTDRLRADLLSALRRFGGEQLATDYLNAYEITRKEHGTPRIPLVLKTLVERSLLVPGVHRELARIFHDFPYGEYLYPGAEHTVGHLKKQGCVLILSDGDAFFQPQKIFATSIPNLVDGVIILPNKVDYFNDLAGYWPADRYVFIDDKQRVLDAAKRYFGRQATTVLVQQGRYVDAASESSADMSAPTIADVTDLFSVSPSETV